MTGPLVLSLLVFFALPLFKELYAPEILFVFCLEHLYFIFLCESSFFVEWKTLTHILATSICFFKYEFLNFFMGRA